MSLTLRTISREQHLAYIQSLPAASHMQVPAWADVKSEWRSENLGWFDATGQLVGAGLVLYRQLPKIKRYLAYLPEGPVINWYAPNLEDWLRPMLAHLKQQGAFSVKMGPPVIIRRWDANAIKSGIQNPDVKRLRDVEATFIEPRAFEVAERLRRMGWQQGEDGGAGFGDVQPRYVFQVPLENRSLEDVHKSFNQLWRRNIKKAEKAGVEVVQGGYEHLPEWQRLYEITAERDHFRPRPLSYFQRMWTALNTEDPNRMRLYFAMHENEVVAAATMLIVGGHVWYSYGASANHKREVRPSNAMQWRMLRDAYALGASVYDLRGISDSLDETDHLFQPVADVQATALRGDHHGEVHHEPGGHGSARRRPEGPHPSRPQAEHQHRAEQQPGVELRGRREPQQHTGGQRAAAGPHQQGGGRKGDGEQVPVDGGREREGGGQSDQQRVPGTAAVRTGRTDRDDRGADHQHAGVDQPVDLLTVLDGAAVRGQPGGDLHEEAGEDRVLQVLHSARDAVRYAVEVRDEVDGEAAAVVEVRYVGVAGVAVLGGGAVEPAAVVARQLLHHAQGEHADGGDRHDPHRGPPARAEQSPAPGRPTDQLAAGRGQRVLGGRPDGLGLWVLAHAHGPILPYEAGGRSQDRPSGR
ncbi:hypothetical protein SANTM175S_06588 [Streptomyces antimycoticus]